MSLRRPRLSLVRMCRLSLEHLHYLVLDLGSQMFFLRLYRVLLAWFRRVWSAWVVLHKWVGCVLLKLTAAYLAAELVQDCLLI